MILLIFACQDESTNDYSSDISALEERLNQIEDVQNENESLSSRVAELEILNASLQDSIDGLYMEVATLNDHLANNTSRLDSLETSTSDLIVSVYEVDCNSTVLYENTAKYRCDLVEGVDPNEMPIVQIYNNRTAGWEYFGEWACGYSGSVCQNAEQSFDYSTPGMGLRFDDTLGLIYTAPYYRSIADSERTTYTVVIIGSQSYTNPN